MPTQHSLVLLDVEFRCAWGGVILVETVPTTILVVIVALRIGTLAAVVVSALVSTLIALVLITIHHWSGTTGARVHLLLIER